MRLVSRSNIAAFSCGKLRYSNTAVQFHIVIDLNVLKKSHLRPFSLTGARAHALAPAHEGPILGEKHLEYGMNTIKKRDLRYDIHEYYYFTCHYDRGCNIARLHPQKYAMRFTRAQRSVGGALAPCPFGALRSPCPLL